MVLVVLGVVLEQVEAVAKPLLVPVLKKPPPGPPKFSSCEKSYTTYFWRGSLIKGRDYKVFDHGRQHRYTVQAVQANE